MVGTCHRERRTNRLFVFLKRVRKCSFLTKIAKKIKNKEKKPKALPGHLQVRQRHLGVAELAGGLSVFALPAQVVGNLLSHHPLFTFSQRTGNLKERTHIQVILQTHR